MTDANYLDQQYDALKYSNEQFDKNVLYIASGALGISFAFIEKIIPDMTRAVSTHLINISWYFFAGVIFLSLVSHFISIMANRWAIAHDDENELQYRKNCTYWNHVIRTLNVIMILGLLAGILFLIQFVNQNI
jgi:hypothetical protein